MAAKFDRNDGAMYRGLLFLERMTFRTADQVITTNESHKRIAVERGRMKPEQVHIVRSGPDLARFKRYPKDPAGARQAPSGGLSGEICKQDGVDYMLRALKNCAMSGPQRHPGRSSSAADPTSRDQGLCRHAGLSDMTTFTGRVKRRGSLPHSFRGRHRHRPRSEERCPTRAQ